MTSDEHDKPCPEPKQDPLDAAAEQGIKCVHGIWLHTPCDECAANPPASVRCMHGVLDRRECFRCPPASESAEDEVGERADDYRQIIARATGENPNGVRCGYARADYYVGYKEGHAKGSASRDGEIAELRQEIWNLKFEASQRWKPSLDKVRADNAKLTAERDELKRSLQLLREANQGLVGAKAVFKPECELHKQTNRMANESIIELETELAEARAELRDNFFTCPSCKYSTMSASAVELTDELMRPWIEERDALGSQLAEARAERDAYAHVYGELKPIPMNQVVASKEIDALKSQLTQAQADVAELVEAVSALPTLFAGNFQTDSPLWRVQSALARVKGGLS